GPRRHLSRGERRRRRVDPAAGPPVPLPGLERVRELRMSRDAGIGGLLLTALQRRGRDLPFGPGLHAACAEPTVPRHHADAAEPRPLPTVVRAARLDLVLRAFAVR